MAMGISSILGTQDLGLQYHQPLVGTRVLWEVAVLMTVVVNTEGNVGAPELKWQKQKDAQCQGDRGRPERAQNNVVCEYRAEDEKNMCEFVSIQINYRRKLFLIKELHLE